jgi:hypothetical protein
METIFEHLDEILSTFSHLNIKNIITLKREKWWLIAGASGCRPAVSGSNPISPQSTPA